MLYVYIELFVMCLLCFGANLLVDSVFFLSRKTLLRQ